MNLRLLSTAFSICLMSWTCHLSLHAAAPTWDFNPQTVGSALLEGGWMLKQPIANLNVSPEFSFPLQLVYLSTRTERGDFGDQWFCPQLESHLLPAEKGVLIWAMPSGGIMGLFADAENKPNQLSDRKGEWHGKITGTLTVISNAEDWQFSYRSGRLISIQSPTGRKLEMTYTGSDLSAVQFSDPAAGLSHNLVTLERQANKRVTAITTPDGKQIFGHEEGRDGRLLSWTHPGTTKADIFSYDKMGLLNGIQPGRLNSERLRFVSVFAPKLDPRGKVIPQPNAEKIMANYRLVSDNTLQYTYSGNPGKITILDKSGGKQSREYAVSRGVESNVDAVGIETKTYYYRAPGKKHDGKLRRIEQGGKILVDNYYDLKTGNLIQSKDQNGESTFYEYDPSTADKPLLADKPIAIYRGKKKDKKLVARIKYDAAGRVSEQTDDSGQTTHYAYTPRGQLDTVTNPDGKKSHVEYDAYGRTTMVVTGDQRQDVGYDEQGRIKSRKTPDGQTIETAYDDLGNVSQIKQNGIVINTFDRDPNGRFLIQRDALGRPTWMEYDGQGHVLAEHQPNGSTTWYAYDPAGRRTTQIDGDGNKIEFGYDASNRMVQQTNPLGQTLTWAYDKQGRLAKRTNGIQTITYDYDDSGRLTLLDYGQPGEKLRYRYDEKGRLQKIKTPTNSLSLFYDDKGRLAAKQFTRGIIGDNGPTSDRVIRYEYNNRGQKTSVVLSEQTLGKVGVSPEPSKPTYRLLQQTQYNYDDAGRLSEIRSNGTAVSTFRYDGKSRLAERSYGNGIIGKYTYDTFGRQSRLDLSGGPLIEPLLLAYDWDAAGQLKSRTWNGEQQIYGYDLSGQLTSVVAASSSGSAGAPPAVSGASPETSRPSSQRQFVSNPAPAKPLLLEKYSYDGAGNLLEKFENGLKTSLTYDTANQLSTTTTPTGTTRFNYDQAGRLVSEDGPAGKTRTYGFLDKVLVLTKGDGARLGYDYYPDGQLAAKGPLSSNPKSEILNQKSPSRGIALLKELVGIKADDDSDLVPSGEQRALNVSEELVWDGLALLYRNGETFAIEPHVSGGIPLASTRDPQNGTHTYYLNDILGTTLAVVHPDRIEIVPLTAFGKPRAVASTTAGAPPSAPTNGPPTFSPENDSAEKNQTEKQN